MRLDNGVKIAVIIPWRDRGFDPLRSANLARVLKQWELYDVPTLVVDDDRRGEAGFNRSAAYNRGIHMADAEVFVLSEADMLISMSQIGDAVNLAVSSPALVMPFTHYHALTEEESVLVRDGEANPVNLVGDRLGNERTARVHGGAINVISRETYDMVGRFDENFVGAWYDDDSMKRAFEICCGPTRFVGGPAYHLYHLSGGEGRHLRPGDREATAHNKARYGRYLRASTPEQIRELTMEG
jgi:hypothetical protein